ncbi:MAG: Uma2 family endonuclease [Coleofasciculaceae cyanobacterium SM2_1_6]|nr:Uma2 family endonuclease [Coleofasciculaceae cyanobacterium SM2_1_6]
MVQSSLKPLTLKEFLELPETKPASEYINGQIIQKNMPQGKHSILQGELTTLINRGLKPASIAWAFPELRCTYPSGSRSSVYGERSIVPDIAVFAYDRLPTDENGEVSNTFLIPPDWTIEILSPDQSQTRVTKNILHCLKYGTQMGWLIDPEDKSVFVYRPKQEIEIFDELEVILPVPNWAIDLQLTIKDLFGYLLK